MALQPAMKQDTRLTTGEEVRQKRPVIVLLRSIPRVRLLQSIQGQQLHRQVLLCTMETYLLLQVMACISDPLRLSLRPPCRLCPSQLLQLDHSANMAQVRAPTDKCGTTETNGLIRQRLHKAALRRMCRVRMVSKQEDRDITEMKGHPLLLGLRYLCRTILLVSQWDNCQLPRASHSATARRQNRVSVQAR